MNSQAKTFQVLSIDAWRYDEGWTWNAWFKVGSVPAEVASYPARKLLSFMRSEGYLTERSKGRVAVEDDGYNLVIVSRGTREPLFAIEYGAEQ